MSRAGSRPSSHRSAASRCISSARGVDSVNEEEFSGFSDWFARQRTLKRSLWPATHESDQQASIHKKILEIGGDLLSRYPGKVPPRVTFDEQEAEKKAQAQLFRHKKHLEKMWQRYAQEQNERNGQTIQDKVAMMRTAYAELERENAIKWRHEFAKEKAAALSEFGDRLQGRLQEQLEARLTELEDSLRVQLERQFQEKLEDHIRREHAQFDDIVRQRVRQERIRIAEQLQNDISAERQQQSERLRKALELLHFLADKHEVLIAQLTTVESDFHDLQLDYKRFMDYTEGIFHSDYLMELREHGGYLAGKSHPPKPDYSYVERVRSFISESNVVGILLAVAVSLAFIDLVIKLLVGFTSVCVLFLGLKTGFFVNLLKATIYGAKETCRNAIGGTKLAVNAFISLCCVCAQWIEKLRSYGKAAASECIAEEFRGGLNEKDFENDELLRSIQKASESESASFGSLTQSFNEKFLLTEFSSELDFSNADESVFQRASSTMRPALRLHDDDLFPHSGVVIEELIEAEQLEAHADFEPLASADLNFDPTE